jgi:hypothetical protein
MIAIIVIIIIIIIIMTMEGSGCGVIEIISRHFPGDTEENYDKL